MIAPPRTVERLLEGLSANIAFRDGVLGDLAEEFALRAEREGAAAARRWYYRESIRTAPHLIRNWARSLRTSEVAHLANVVLAAYVLTTLVGVFVAMVAGSIMIALGISSPILIPSTGGRLAPVVGLTLGTSAALLGGYIAAWLDNITPLVSAFVLGVIWSSAGTLVSAFVGASEPAWFRVCASLVIVTGTTIGGILHVRATRFVSPEVTPTHLAGH